MLDLAGVVENRKPTISEYQLGQWEWAKFCWLDKLNYTIGEASQMFGDIKHIFPRNKTRDMHFILSYKVCESVLWET